MPRGLRAVPGGSSAASLVRRATRWRARRYDLAINFEGDIRSHGLLALAGAKRRVGFAHAGGGPLLTDVVEFDGGRHVADNGLALVERAFDLPSGSLRGRHDRRPAHRSGSLPLPEAARAAAQRQLAQLGRGSAGARTARGWPSTRRVAGPSSSGRSSDLPTPPRCSPQTSAPRSSSPARPAMRPS